MGEKLPPENGRKYVELLDELSELKEIPEEAFLRWWAGDGHRFGIDPNRIHQLIATLPECVIRLAVCALEIFPTLRERPRTGKPAQFRRFFEYQRAHPETAGLDLQTCAGLAIHVRDALARTSDDDL